MVPAIVTADSGVPAISYRRTKSSSIPDPRICSVLLLHYGRPFFHREPHSKQTYYLAGHTLFCNTYRERVCHLRCRIHPGAALYPVLYVFGDSVPTLLARSQRSGSDRLIVVVCWKFTFQGNRCDAAFH